MLSLGTPAIKIGKHSWLGVGHAKISVTGSYDKTSAIYKFRNDVRIALSQTKHYHNVPHNSFIYVMYFFLFNSDLRQLKISDCYLPMSGRQMYSFSVVFPMTVMTKAETYNVSCRIGDFYTVVLTFNQQQVHRSCRGRTL